MLIKLPETMEVRCNRPRQWGPHPIPTARHNYPKSLQCSPKQARRMRNPLLRLGPNGTTHICERANIEHVCDTSWFWKQRGNTKTSTKTVPSPSASCEEIYELIGLHVQQLVEVHPPIGELAKGTLLCSSFISHDGQPFKLSGELQLEGGIDWAPGQSGGCSLCGIDHLEPRGSLRSTSEVKESPAFRTPNN